MRAGIWKEVGPTALPVCAQESGQWLKTPVARRRADKQINWLHSGRLFENFETCGNYDFGFNFTSESSPCALRTPRLSQPAG